MYLSNFICMFAINRYISHQSRLNIICERLRKHTVGQWLFRDWMKLEEGETTKLSICAERRMYCLQGKDL